MYSYGSPHMAAQKQDDQHERTFSSYVRIRDVVLKTYLGRWTIGRSGERGSGMSVLPARYDDDDRKVHCVQTNVNENVFATEKKCRKKILYVSKHYFTSNNRVTMLFTKLCLVVAQGLMYGAHKETWTHY